jgi:hypothetical protein
MTIGEAIQNALDYIEVANGHKNGAIYEDLAQAQRFLGDNTAELDTELEED